MRYRPLYSLGNSLFSDILLIIYFVVIVMITDHAVFMQPWIRLTLYNPNQCKFLNYVTHFLVVVFHQKLWQFYILGLHTDNTRARRFACC